MTDPATQTEADPASDLKSLRNRSRKLLATAGIAKTILVDDQLVPSDVEQVVVTLLVAAEGNKISLGGKALGPFGGPEDDEGRDQMGRQWEAIAPADRRKGWWDAARRSPLTFTDVASLAALLPSVTPCPPEDWDALEQQLVEAGEAGSTLVIFDRDLGTGRPDDGDGLIARWLGHPGARGVILTSTAAGGDPEANDARPSEQRLAAEIASQADGLEPEQVIVASKDDLGLDGLDRLLHALRIGLSAPELVALRDRVLSAAAESHRDAVAQIEGLDLRALEDVVVRSSRMEGVFEADTLLRAVDLHYRHAVREAVTDQLADLVNLTGPVRALAAQASVTDHPSSVQVAAELHTIERWDRVETVNAAGHPIASGDVLQLGDGSCWIVCEQSCDLALRDDSVTRRLGRTVPIVPLQAEQPKRRQGAWALPEPLPEGGAATEIRWARLGGAEQLPLLAADLCSFDETGRSRIDFDAESPLPALTPGLEKLHVAAKERFAERRQQFGDLHLPLTFGSLPMGVEVAMDGTVASFGVRRVGRLARPYADALLAALNSYRSRAAYEHDLGRFRPEDETDEIA